MKDFSMSMSSYERIISQLTQDTIIYRGNHSFHWVELMKKPHTKSLQEMIIYIRKLLLIWGGVDGKTTHEESIIFICILFSTQGGVDGQPHTKCVFSIYLYMCSLYIHICVLYIPNGKPTHEVYVYIHQAVGNVRWAAYVQTIGVCKP